MQNVPIKFRGKHFWMYVYGYYIERNWYDGGRRCFIVQNDGTWSQIYSGSAEQLIGYDADGNEVYEGDKIFDVDNPADTVTAELYPCVHLNFYKLKGE